ncbi:L-threonylcarbamoyladenylate synthase [Dolosicoccus paucivorans]|uniref:Translation factor (SUA5) n=1 Tax=Dolosicoccus paucivorans TaxID=84521 RepID=A0A1G8JP00_9LACT|nr:Sua5/YciO/YrdC/YwlC family protein [Dolosicoccus paucivorans]PMC58351.1 translation factor (SUA5) [Dolosicoccus paucivorans]SDI32938.1 tRNA A37 threonylcarbamoyladenosine synthetase subunit TsaC/SUA5/YrdC [Dolosicoccus paucivorans]
MTQQRMKWNGGVQQEAVDLLLGDGGAIVCPTKVGYIVGTSDYKGLERKFEMKHRARNKPGVVLVGSMDQLREIAEMTPEIEDLYQKCWDSDALLGCILPWKESGKKYIPADGSEELMTDVLGTSCFVIKFGVPGEKIAKAMWDQDKRLMFASSANPSGKGNRGMVEYIGEDIENAADLIIEGNDYVASIQPDKTVETRYEQGVMVSFVDEEGKLVPRQKPTDRSTSPCPVLIRKGLDVDEIMGYLAESWNSWDYRHGQYY